MITLQFDNPTYMHNGSIFICLTKEPIKQKLSHLIKPPTFSWSTFLNSQLYPSDSIGILRLPIFHTIHKLTEKSHNSTEQIVPMFPYLLITSPPQPSNNFPSSHDFLGQLFYMERSDCVSPSTALLSAWIKMRNRQTKGWLEWAFRRIYLCIALVCTYSHTLFTTSTKTIATLQCTQAPTSQRHPD